MEYNSMEMLQKHLRGEAVDTVNIPPTQDKPSSINPKMKQFFEVEAKIEPFYSGGKIVDLPGSKFICKCGSSVKLVSTAAAVIVQNEDTDDSGIENSVDSVKSSMSKFGVEKTFECDMDEIISFDACASSCILITSHKSQLLRFWDITTGKVIQTIKSYHTVPIIHTEIYKSEAATLKTEDSDEGIVEGEVVPLVGGHEKLTWATVAGNCVKVWQARGSFVSKQIIINGVPSMGFIKWETSYSADSRLFVAERKIYCIGRDVVGAAQFSIKQTLTGHYSQVTGIEFNKNVMLSAARDKTIILWDTSTPVYQKQRTLGFPGIIESTVLLSNDLYISTLNGVIRHMDLETMTITPEDSMVLTEGDETIVTLHPPMHQGLEFESPNFFISSHLSTLYQMRKSKGKKKKSKLRISNQFVGTLEEILDVRLWGKERVAVATNSAVIKIYNLASGSCQFLRGHKDIVLSLSSSKEYLVSASKDNRIIFWEPESSEPYKIHEGHLASVSGVCFHPTKSQVYSVAEDNFLKLWTLEKCLKSAVAHEKEINAVDCSPNGALVATASRDKSCKIWDAKTLLLQGTLKGHKKSIWDVKFSNWDQLCVTSSADTTLKIWNLITRECIKTLQGHQSSVLRGRFINSGLQVVSSGTDGTVRAWDLRNSQCITTLENSDAKIWALDCTLNGNLIVTGSADSYLMLWRDITEQKIKESRIQRKIITESEQKLNNVIEQGNWTSGMQLAINLGRPFALLRIVRNMPTSEYDLIPGIIKKLSDQDKTTLVGYVEKWNTNTKTSAEAQLLLNIIFKTIHPKFLSFLNTASLLPYSEKHYQRLLRIQQDVCIVRFLAEEGSFMGRVTRQFGDDKMQISDVTDEKKIEDGEISGNLTNSSNAVQNEEPMEVDS